jgi:RNA polymerase sigma-70 factor (ECF subfamily)
MSSHPAGPPENELIVRAKYGDTVAFGDLYEQHLNAVYRYVLYRIGDVAEAEDLTEVVFLKAWEALGGYELRAAPFSAWLYRIAHNVLVDRHRTRKPDVSLESQWPLRDEADGPEDVLDARESREAVLHALGELAPDYQQVLALRFISGLSHSEAARVLNRSVDAVRVLQHRALNALRRRLDEKATTRR